MIETIETFAAFVDATDITITLERRCNGALSSCMPIWTIPLPARKFGITWLNDAIKAKGFTVESTWIMSVGQDRQRMEAVLAEVR